MADELDQRRRLDTERMEERLKQMAFDHFSACYVRHDIAGMTAQVDERVQVIGESEYFIAHNRKEYEDLLRRRIEDIPMDCVVKASFLTAAAYAGNVYVVNGELELRIPYQTQIAYDNLRFSMTFVPDGPDFRIISIQTAVKRSDSFIHKYDDLQLLHVAEEVDDENRRDILTGLYTLDAFKEEVAGCLQKDKSDVGYAMLCTDVSHYERVNNLYGLKRADQILVELAALLTTSSQTVKVCGRSVADHFVLLVTYREAASLKRFLVELCSAFEMRISERYSEARPRLGIGVYLIHDRTEDIGRMVECANVARKSLRVQKKERVAFYDVRIFQRMEKAKRIEHSMTRALAEGEFCTFFQPKYDLITEKIVGAEALCRWIRPDGTMVYPDEFIPVFENNGFIVNLDFYMLKETCQMLQRRLSEKRFCVPVSINQSRVLLGDDEYVQKIASVLTRYKTPAQYIELELTERIFKDNLADIGRTMANLKEIGIRWSIDDFGTGYSSLNLLKDLPVDIIKLDKSFLDETENSETSRAIIRKTVELTQELNKKVVCEGVETPSQAEYLRGIRCDVAQGYLYAKPMPMEEFEQLLDKEMYTK